MDKLKLEFPTMAREKDAKEYIKELCDYGSEIHGVSSLDQYIDDYPAWLKLVEEGRYIEPSEELVPAEAYFLVRESDNRIVGMVSIRLALNHALWNYGGHIGYSIRPSERRKGYNKINLYLALEICAKHGLEAVLLDCDKENIGSAKTMQALGGKMIYEFFDHERNITIQNYVIDVKEALKKSIID